MMIVDSRGKKAGRTTCLRGFRVLAQIKNETGTSATDDTDRSDRETNRTDIGLGTRVNGRESLRSNIQQRTTNTERVSGWYRVVPDKTALYRIKFFQELMKAKDKEG